MNQRNLAFSLGFYQNSICWTLFGLCDGAINAAMEPALQTNHRSRQKSSKNDVHNVHIKWPTCGVGFIWFINFYHSTS